MVSEHWGETLHKPAIPLVDLDIVRETLSYIRDDIRRVPGLEKAADRVTAALAEIADYEGRRLSPLSQSRIEVRIPLRRKH
jgi:hypothetical protein